MKVACEIKDYTGTDRIYADKDRPIIFIRSVWPDGDMVELEVRGEKCKVNAEELISAVTRAKLGCLGNW